MMRIPVPDDDASAWGTVLEHHMYPVHPNDLSMYNSYSDVLEQLVVLADKYDMQGVLNSIELHILQRPPQAHSVSEAFKVTFR